MMNLENITKTLTQNGDKWTDWSYIREHIFLCIAKQDTVRNAVVRNYLNVSMYMRVCVDSAIDDSLSYKVTKELICKSGVPEELFWLAAEENRRKYCSVRPMSKMLGFPASDDEMIYVATTNGIPGGAGALYLTDMFRLFCQLHDEASLFVLPSSSEELLILPESKIADYATAKDLAELVQSVNGTPDLVDPQIQLDPVVYQYRMDQNTVSIAERA